MVYYVRQALAIAQVDLISSGFHVQFDVDAIFGRVSHSSLGWESNLLEDPKYEWWLGIYDELVHTRPYMDPPMLLPLALAEPDAGEATDTSEPGNGGNGGQADDGAGNA